MKNKTLIICAGILLLVFLTYGTYAWYTYFLGISGNVVSSNATIKTTLTICLRLQTSLSLVQAL